MGAWVTETHKVLTQLGDYNIVIRRKSSCADTKSHLASTKMIAFVCAWRQMQ